jgi:hypothetical protein
LLYCKIMLSSADIFWLHIIKVYSLRSEITCEQVLSYTRNCFLPYIWIYYFLSYAVGILFLLVWTFVTMLVLYIYKNYFYFYYLLLASRNIEYPRLIPSKAWWYNISTSRP